MFLIQPRDLLNAYYELGTTVTFRLHLYNRTDDRCRTIRVWLKLKIFLSLPTQRLSSLPLFHSLKRKLVTRIGTFTFLPCTHFFINKIHFGYPNNLSKDTDVGKDGTMVESDLSTDTAQQWPALNLALNSEPGPALGTGPY